MLVAAQFRPGATATTTGVTVPVIRDNGRVRNVLVAVSAEVTAPSGHPLLLHLTDVDGDDVREGPGVYRADQVHCEDPDDCRYEPPLEVRYLSSDPTRAMTEAARPLGPGDRATRSGDRLPAHLPDQQRARVPLGPHPGPQFRPLPHLRRAQQIPETYQAFATYLDAYGAAHFAHDPGGTAVADATLSLLNAWYPGRAGPVMRKVSLCLMDPPLRDAFGYPHPNPHLERAVRTGLRLRGRLERFLPPRRKSFHARNSRTIRNYPDGFAVEGLGTFPEREEDPGAGAPGG